MNFQEGQDAQWLRDTMNRECPSSILQWYGSIHPKRLRLIRWATSHCKHLKASEPPKGWAARLRRNKIYGKGSGQVEPMQPIRPWIVGEIGVFAAM